MWVDMSGSCTFRIQNAIDADVDMRWGSHDRPRSLKTPKFLPLTKTNEITKTRLEKNTLVNWNKNKNEAFQKYTKTVLYVYKIKINSNKIKL